MGYLGSGNVGIVKASVVGLTAKGVSAVVALIPGRIVTAKASKGVNATLGVGRCDGGTRICSHDESSNIY